MKKLILICLGLAFAFQVAAQQQPNTKEYYLEKSKRNKTTGFILAGAALAMIATGILTMNDKSIMTENSSFSSGAVIMGIGVGASLARIPLFISANNNVKKSAVLSLDRK